MKEKIMKILDKYIDKLEEKGELKSEDITLLTLLLTFVDRPIFDTYGLSNGSDK